MYHRLPRTAITHHVAPTQYRCRIGVLHTFDLALLRNGSNDPTTRVEFVGDDAVIRRATLTPLGPGTIVFRAPLHLVSGSALDSQTTPAPRVLQLHGPGADWLAARISHMAAQRDDTATQLTSTIAKYPHPALQQAARRLGVLWLPRTDTPYHELLPAILGQRITAAQALAQWAGLCRRYGEPAPGNLGLHLPPTPEQLRAISSWQFHQMGIEQQRARTLHTVARHAAYVDRTRDVTGPQARAALMKLPGIGVWTAAVAVGVSHGDPDALPIGDFHVKNTVSWALRGAARGSDDEMVEALTPFAGHRWRVVRLLERSGTRAPKFGPKRRLLDVARL